MRRPLINPPSAPITAGAIDERRASPASLVNINEYISAESTIPSGQGFAVWGSPYANNINSGINGISGANPSEAALKNGSNITAIAVIETSVAVDQYAAINGARMRVGE